MRYFGRQVIFQMIPDGEVEGVSYSGLSMSFVAEKGVSGRGKGIVEVKGLTSQDRQLAKARGTTFRVLAGYDVPSVVLEGQAVKGGVDSKRQGPEQVLQVEIRDGARRTELAQVNINFAGETTIEQAINTVAETLGLPLGSVRLPLRAAETFPYGTVLVGPAWRVLERLCESIGAECATVDGALQILGYDETFEGIDVPLLSPVEGTLVGEPSGRDGRVELVAFLDSRYRPGSMVAVRDTVEFDGDYRIESLRHEGSSGDDPTYYTTLICRRLRPR